LSAARPEGGSLTHGMPSSQQAPCSGKPADRPKRAGLRRGLPGGVHIACIGCHKPSITAAAAAADPTDYTGRDCLWEPPTSGV